MKQNKLKLITKILAIIIVCLISFVGVYVHKYNGMENIIKDYKLSKDLEGYRQIVLEVSEDEEDETDEEEDEEETEEEETDEEESEEEDSEENTTEEEIDEDETEETSQEDLTSSYELAKSIIENRLKNMQDLSSYEKTQNIEVSDYNISLDKQTGAICLQIAENDATDYVVSNIYESSTFEMSDSEDGTVYLTNEHIKEAKAVYNTDTDGTIVYLEIEFTDEGAEIIKDLSENEYAASDDTDEEEEDTDEEETTDEETDESEDTESDEETTEEEETDEESEEVEEDEETTDEEEEETQKEVTISISGEELITASFSEAMTEGIIDISMNTATSDTDEIYEYLESTEMIALLLNSGALPVEYEVAENLYIATDISQDLIKIAMAVVVAIIAILLIFMIIKHKSRGLLGAISFIGFVALYLLLIRYANITITLGSMIGGVLILFMNYVFTLALLKQDPENKVMYNKKYLQMLVKLIPAFAVSIVFIFASNLALNSFGIMMFWGMVLIGIYNIIITKNLVD